MAERGFKCSNCQQGYRGKVTLRWPVNASASRYYNVCGDCLDKLSKEGAPCPDTRAFISWYMDNKVEVSAETMVRRQKSRIKELEDLVREQARMLEKYGSLKG